MKNFYKTNFANGEFRKHKGAYLAFFLAGALLTQYNSCDLEKIVEPTKIEYSK